jgi:hypothetical protein
MAANRGVERVVPRVPVFRREVRSGKASPGPDSDLKPLEEIASPASVKRFRPESAPAVIA